LEERFSRLSISFDELLVLVGARRSIVDIFSTILYGSRISIFVGFASMVLAMIIGICLGLISGYIGGAVETFIMRIADVQISFPAILIALLIDGVVRSLLPNERHDELAVWVLILAIGVSNWVHFARTVRGSTLVEKNKEYVQAARVIGRRRATIMFRHVLPNVMGPVLVIATIGLAIAILTEATLSFLGVGAPPTKPSLFKSPGMSAPGSNGFNNSLGARSVSEMRTSSRMPFR
jgi:peptide/nickel transport system permease protein